MIFKTFCNFNTFYVSVKFIQMMSATNCRLSRERLRVRFRTVHGLSVLFMCRHFILFFAKQDLCAQQLEVFLFVPGLQCFRICAMCYFLPIFTYNPCSFLAAGKMDKGSHDVTLLMTFPSCLHHVPGNCRLSLAHNFGGRRLRISSSYLHMVCIPSGKLLAFSYRFLGRF